MKKEKMFNWLSAIDPQNKVEVDRLEEKMVSFYTHHKNYFDYADDISTLWTKDAYAPYQSLLNLLRGATAMLEIGCGKANVLKYYPELTEAYCGADFSEKLIASNQTQFPNAAFARIERPDRIPFRDESFDTVFNVFVLEHVVRPHVLLNEMLRVLKPGGQMVIICPNYMGHGWMASQQLGFSQGSGRQKLAKGKILDAGLTMVQSRILIPSKIRELKRANLARPGFWINCDPVCFRFPFQPDVDAVYITDADEIQTYLNSSIAWKQNQASLQEFLHHRRLIFLHGIKQLTRTV